MYDVKNCVKRFTQVKKHGSHESKYMDGGI